MQAGVLGFVHYTHATAAQLLDDAVVRNCLANHAHAMCGIRSAAEGNQRE
jgi:hypothetical protein